MALTKVINDLADLNLSGSTNSLKGCTGTTAQQPVSSSSIEYLIVGGGGGNGTLSGGAGAGGLLTGTTTVYHGTPTVITIGKGGPAGPASYPDPLWSRNGDDSGFNGIRAIGGGSGGSHGVSNNGIDGGSGGGAGSGTSVFSVGSGTSGQGMDGGVNAGNASPAYGAGGGGGASTTALGAADGTGGTGTSSLGGTGGSGRNMNSFISSTNANLAQIGDVSGSDVWFAGGGGGGAQSSSAAGTPFGGPTYPAYANGGGGHGGDASRINAQEGLRNTGGGAGGAGYSGSWGAGAEGGSGVGVLKYDNTEVSSYTLNSGDTYTVNWPADKYGVAYWPLNLNVKDVGGNYDGTATDITYVTGRCRNIGCTPDQAASFNGSSSYIDTTFFVPPTSSLSSSVWFKTSSTAYRHYLFGDFNSGGADLSARFSLNVNASNNFEVIFGNGSTSDTWNSISASSYLDGNWHNVVLTGNGTALKLYVDGSLIGTDTFLVPVGTAGAQSMVLGRPGDYNGVYWNGQLEQMRFYASELSLTDVQDIYNNSKPGSLPPLKTSSDLTTTTCDYPSGITGTALYQFEGDATDTCGTYDLTATGSPSYVTGKFGTAIQFNGTSQGVTSTSAVIPNPAATISLWYNGNGTATAEFYIIGAGVGGSSYGLDIHYYNGNFWAGVVDGGSFQGVGTGYTSVSTSEWYHLALTWDGSTSTDSMKFYINGVLETNITPTITAASLTYSSFGIGKTSTATYAPGIVDQVRIYGSVLTSQQIYDLWQKENNIQTHFSSTDPADTTPTDTDILVFKEGSGEITFKNDTPPGAEIGMLRHNNTLGQMEHFNSGGWKDFTNCSTSTCNYPTTGSLLYQFNRNTNDICNSSNNGTPVNNPTFDSGKFGQSIVFNGSNQGVNVPSNVLPSNSTSSSSVSFWFKNLANPAAGGTGVLFNSWDGNTGNPGYTLNLESAYSSYPDGSLFLVNYYLDGTAYGSQGSISYQDGLWHHIAVVFDISASTLSCYVDGNSTPELSISGLTTSPVDPWANGGEIGYMVPGGPFRYFNGFIDQFRIFPSALTTGQISQLYNEIYCP